MFGTYDLLRPEEEKEIPKRPKSPPRTCEEWLSRQGYHQWPAYAPEEGLAGPGGNDSILGSLEDIKNDLKKHSSWDSGFLESIDSRLQSLEVTLNQCADRFVCEPNSTAKESVAGGLANITNKTFLTELCDMELLNSRKLHTIPKQLLRKERGNEKTANGAVFPGFTEQNSAVPLPGKLEALPILDLVTKTQSMPPYLTKPWRKIFYADASCSLFQFNGLYVGLTPRLPLSFALGKKNTFWWIWMEWFRPNPLQQSILFAMGADNFVSLLYSMSHKHKDEVFMHYPGCLAQALYSAFCNAFPGSNKILNSESFVTYLADLTSEWIAGVRSSPRSWEKWSRHLLDPYHSVKELQDTGRTTTTTTTTTFSEKDVLQLSRPLSPRRTPRSLHFRQQSPTLPRQMSTLSRTTLPRQMSTLSRTTHTDEGGEKPLGIAPGPTYECVRFGVLGRSPLLQHYLLTHNITENVHNGPLVSRTQVKELPPPSMTYKQLLERSAAISDEKYQTFERQVARSNLEIAASLKKRRAELRLLEKHNKRVLLHKHEVTILAEKLIAKNSTLPPVRTKSAMK